MKVVLFNNKLYTLNLPAKIDGSFSLQDIPNSEDILVNIEESNNGWVMNATNEYKIQDGPSLVDSVQIKPNTFYILNSNSNNRKLVYVEDSVDKSFITYKVNENSQFVIGKNTDNQISYSNNYLLGQHLVLFYKDGNWMCQLAPKASVYVNRNLIIKQQFNLKNGDVIFLYGLRIILMGNVIMINNPGGNVMINSKSLSIYEVHQEPFNYEEIKEIDYYSENDYFFKTPRMRRFIETYDLKFANPPQIQKPNDMPWLLTVGPSLTMGLMSVMTLVSTFTTMSGGKNNKIQVAIRVVSAISMLAGSLIWPNLSRKYQKKKILQQNKEREEKYRAYLVKKQQEMEKEATNQTSILNENLMTLPECFQTIVNKRRILWERKVEQKDFLTVRVGIGDIPIDMDIKFNDDDDFEIEEDPLKNEASAIVQKNKNLNRVPVGYSFYNKKATAIMGMEDKFDGFIKDIILQLVTYHSYDDLKIVILTDKKNESKWEVYKNLPHCFSNNKQIRFFATDTEETKTISTYLEQELIGRANMTTKDVQVENEDKENDGTFSPYYLIFTDCFSKVRRLGISELILKHKENFGFGFVIIENSLGKLPSECVNFITLGNQTSGILNNEIDNYQHTDFVDEIDNNIDIEKCCEVLANIPIEFYEDVRFLPKSLGFLEMQKVGKVEQLNSLNRWRLNDPTKSLRAAIGVNDLGNMIYLDLHEKFHGPHGLVAGMTGSGKSEFIITYILSMALNYSPEEVSFILIDYKGGGLAGAFENKSQNIRLPHLAGTITNLDKAELNRTLVSIDSELRKRQKKFNEARDKLGESTIDIYKYQKFYRQKKVSEPIPHLFIISDEFAELKAQQPEFMDNLISTARIGRSLGVHLILATQKPSGVVNAQIWSNSKFRVCLKVQDKSDSDEMIKKPDAAEIKEAGRFYLQVGYDEVFLYGQSGYGGTPYIPSDTVNTEIDRAINYLDNLGQSIKDYEETTTTKATAQGDELSNVLKYVTALARREGLEAPRLWMDNIPETIYTESLMKKYNYVPEKWNLEAIIGEYDDPSNQYQDLLKLKLGNSGNTIVYGVSGSNREMFLSTLIYSICLTHTAEEVNFYIFDFGSESLRMFMNMPQVGDIVFASEDDKVNKLHKMIQEEIATRKKLFADYNGEYENYLKNSGKTLPRKIYIFNNMDSYKEIYPNVDELLVRYSREGLRYGIILILTTTSQAGLYSRLLRNFENTYVLDMPNADNYAAILGKIGKVYPANYPGRGLFKGELAYEYQTAQIYPKDNLVEYIKKKIVEIKEKNPTEAEPIPVLPDEINIKLLLEDNIKLSNVPLGIYKESLTKAYYNFENDKGTVISSNDESALLRFVKNLLNIINKRIENKIFIIDCDKQLDEYSELVDSYVTNLSDELITPIIDTLNSSSDKTLVVIAGIEKFKGSLSADVFNKLINAFTSKENINVILMDVSFKLKKLMFDTWYGELFVNMNGIWVGNGFADQSIIRLTEISRDYRIKIGNEFFWFVKAGVATLVKGITDQENGDNNEE